MGPAAYICGIAYALGDRASLDDFKGQGVDESSRAVLQGLGFRNFYHEGRDTSEMCYESLERTLSSAKMDADDIGAVLVLNASRDGGAVDEPAILQALLRLGFRKVPVLSLGMLYCAGFCGLLKVASEMASARMQNILVLTLGRVRPGHSRIGIANNYLFSDGAASCIVSPDAGQFEIVQLDTASDLQLAGLAPSPTSFQERSLRLLDDLREIFRETFSGAQTSPADTRLFLGLNMSSVAVQILGEVAGFPKDRIYLGNIGEYAHAFACDHLLNIATCKDTPTFVPGDRIMLAGWHLHSVGSGMLRVV